MRLFDSLGRYCAAGGQPVWREQVNDSQGSHGKTSGTGQKSVRTGKTRIGKQQSGAASARRGSHAAKICPEQWMVVSAQRAVNSKIRVKIHDKNAVFFDKFKKGIKVEALYNDKKIGTFYITDCALPTETDDYIATITSYDLLYTLINQDITPTFEILDGVDIKEYIKQVFVSVGIAEEKIIVSDKIAGTLNYSVCQGKTLAEILKEYCLATDTYIFVDADENICVIPKVQDIPENCPILDDNTLYGLDLGSTFKDAYTGLKILYNRLTIGDQEELLKLETTLQPQTLTELKNNELKNPLYILNSVKIDGAYALLNSIEASQNLLSLSLTSDETEEKTATITVLGKNIKFVESFVTQKEENTNENILELKSQLIQDTNTANTLLNTLFTRLNNRVVTAYSMPDDFDIELCKIFNISSSEKRLNPIYAYVHSYRFTIVEGDVDLVITLKEIKGVEESGV